MTRENVRRLRALRLLFAFEAASMAMVLPRIPDLRDHLELSPSDLGLALTGIPVGSLLGFLVAPRLVRIWGSGTVAWASVAFLAVAFVAVASAGSLQAFAVAWGCVGIGVTHTEIALNARASRFEAETGRAAMTSSHGYWSIGSIVGVLIGGVAAKLDIQVWVQTLVAALVFVPISARLGLLLRNKPHQSHGRRGFILPSRELLPLCFLPVGVLAIESVFMEWSTVFLLDVLAADAFASSLGVLSFSVATAISRLSAEHVAARVGNTRHAVISTLAAGAGAAVFAFAPSLPVALVGAFAAGFGAAPIYPLALSRAGRVDGGPEDSIAVVSFAVLGLLLGLPAAFGAAIDAFGPRLAHLVVALLSLPTVLIVLRLEVRR